MLTETRVESLGKYRLIAELGHGEMVDVFLAIACGLAGFNKLLVLKQLRPDLADDPAVLKMFVDEARLAARLNHPNVVQTYEIAQHDGRYYIATEFLEGQPLKNIFHRCIDQGGVPLPLYLHILVQVLTGLHHAHELADYDGRPLNVVHRNLSPHNVFVTYDGQVKIVDFGIAKALERTTGACDGPPISKPFYSAPEQAARETISSKTDLFSVGVMLWEAIAQRRLWNGLSHDDICDRLAHGKIPSIDELCPDSPKELRTICSRALALNPQDRFSSALEFQFALEALLKRNSQHVQRRDLADFVSRLFATEQDRLRALIDVQTRLLRNDTDTSAELQQTLTSPSFSMSQETQGSLPGASSLSGAVASNPPTTAPSRRFPGIFFIAAAAVIGFSLSMAFFSRRSSRTDPSSNSLVSHSQANALPAEPLASLASPRPVDIVITFRASPAEARIFLDARMLAGNPHSARLPQDNSIHHVRIEASGYVSVERELSFDKSIDIEISLERPDRPPRSPKASSLSSRDSSAAPVERAQPVPPPASKPNKHPGRIIDTDNPWSD